MQRRQAEPGIDESSSRPYQNEDMTLVASYIAMWIFIAAAFGFLVGWLARGRSTAPARKKKRHLPR